MALYMIGFITYGATLVFYAAAFPRLARNTARARELREKYESGEMSKEEYDLEECLEKNHISNISTVSVPDIQISLFLINHLTDSQQRRIHRDTLHQPLCSYTFEE